MKANHSGFASVVRTNFKKEDHFLLCNTEVAHRILWTQLEIHINISKDVCGFQRTRRAHSGTHSGITTSCKKEVFHYLIVIDECKQSPGNA